MSKSDVQVQKSKLEHFGIRSINPAKPIVALALTIKPDIKHSILKPVNDACDPIHVGESQLCMTSSSSSSKHAIFNSLTGENTSRGISHRVSGNSRVKFKVGKGVHILPWDNVNLRVQGSITQMIRTNNITPRSPAGVMYINSIQQGGGEYLTNAAAELNLDPEEGESGLPCGDTVPSSIEPGLQDSSPKVLDRK